MVMDGDIIEFRCNI
ncbi:MAG: hypothetical protein QF888_04450 [Desulfobacterales bacterium]|nr:hypothetical protein [Desulfobacterales bacterium]MDP7417228.1 hypothetical protein [Desulfobacterales bacterium]